VGSQRLFTFFLTLALTGAFSQQPDGDSQRTQPGSWAVERGDRYILMLEDPPLAALPQFASRAEFKADRPERRAILARQSQIVRALQERKARVVLQTDTLLNAIFVDARTADPEELAQLPGVRGVYLAKAARRQANTALDLVRARNAWAQVGGQGNAGAGVRIGVIDSGIDHRHPAFNDEGFTVPAGFPRATPGDLAFTNRKVIVARSYVASVAAGDGTVADSRPDDNSARDRVGHGTAVAMLAAGVPVNGTAVGTVSGVAPRAWLGSYKVFGSPGVNDTTFADVIIDALTDAFNDGMDVVTLSLGLPATYGLRDRCSGRPCDPWSNAIENASRGAMAVVVAAGNDGDLGLKLPTLGSITTPGTAPGAITVGATTNSHFVSSQARLQGPGVPSALAAAPVLFSPDAPTPSAPLTAPVRDVARLENDGKACRPIPNNALAGAIALIEQGGCLFFTKASNAARAGAVAVLIYRTGGNFLFPLQGLTESPVPVALIGRDNGQALKQFLANNPERPLTLDPAWVEFPGQTPDEIAYFSAQGPSITDLEIKPDVVAPGTDLYMATQTYDPNGDMYHPSGYTVAQGTSFSVGLVAGAAAIAKQRFPRATGAQIKSLVVNTARPNVTDYDENNRPVPAKVTAMGAGLLDVDAAARSSVAAEPAVISFGNVGVTGATLSRSLRLTNLGNTPIALRLSVTRPVIDPRATVTVNPSSGTLQPGGSTTITVRIERSQVSAPGAYEGAILVQGGANELRIPYLYLVGDGAPYNAFPLTNSSFVRGQNSEVVITVKVTDRYGVPVERVPLTYAPASNVVNAGLRTDDLGISDAVMNVGSQPGEITFTANAGGLTVFFDGRVRLRPTIPVNGVRNAADGEVGQGFAPGSYISIFGTGLAENTLAFRTPYLPIALAGVSVSFDDPGRRISLPGRLHFVSPGQVNVQIPWELEGLTSVQMKVSIGSTSSAIYTLPLTGNSPAFFEYTDAAGRRLAAARDERNAVTGSDNPVERGRVVQLFLNGLGPVTNRPASGEPAQADPLSRTTFTPQVTIGGQQAAIQFSGLAPFNVGLYQVNVVVPPNIGTGVQPVVISINGVRSTASALVVR
jgi:uncharacterized protein (TIGR03437 family)